MQIFFLQYCFTIVIKAESIKYHYIRVESTFYKPTEHEGIYIYNITVTQEREVKQLYIIISIHTKQGHNKNKKTRV